MLPQIFEHPPTPDPKHRLGSFRPTTPENFEEIGLLIFEMSRVEEKFSMTKTRAWTPVLERAFSRLIVAP